MQDEMGAKKRYQVGRFMMGAVSDDVQGLAISSKNAYGTEMSNLQESQELSLLTTDKLEREDIFKLYIIKRFDSLDNYQVTPDTDLKGLLDRNAVQFLYLCRSTNYYKYSGKFCYRKLTFKSLNDKLADTGYSIANYVQMARAGEGYAWPRLKLGSKEEIPNNQRHGYANNPNLVLNRKKPEDPEEYDKLTEEQKKEIEPKVTTNYFKLLQQEVALQKVRLEAVEKENKSLKAKLVELMNKLLIRRKSNGTSY